MSTVTLKKTPVETKWNLEKIQEESVRVFATHFVTAIDVISHFGEPALNEFRNQLRQHRVAHLRQLGVKTPFELVRAIADFEHNVWGSKIEIGGDDQVAQLSYNSCAMWNALQKYGLIKKDSEELMGKNFESSMQDLAKDFGFKAETRYEEPVCTITFTKT